MDTKMKWQIVLLILIAGSAFAEGPIYRHQDKTENLEFQNVYQDLRAIVRITSVTLPSGSTQYIQNTISSQNAIFNVSSGTLRSQLSVNGQILVGTGSVTSPQYSKSGDLDTGMSIPTADTLMFVTAGAAVSTMTSVGEVLQPLQPSFLVTNSTGAADVTGDGTTYTVSWGNEIFDQGSDFSANTFTAPVTGRYFLRATILIKGITSSHTDVCEFKLVTSNRSYEGIYNPNTWLGSNTTGFLTMVVGVIADMDAGDTATTTINVQASTKVIDIHNDAQFNYFSGSLIN